MRPTNTIQWPFTFFERHISSLKIIIPHHQTYLTCYHLQTYLTFYRFTLPQCTHLLECFCIYSHIACCYSARFSCVKLIIYVTEKHYCAQLWRCNQRHDLDCFHNSNWWRWSRYHTGLLVLTRPGISYQPAQIDACFKSNMQYACIVNVKETFLWVLSIHVTGTRILSPAVCSTWWPSWGLSNSCGPWSKRDNWGQGKWQMQQSGFTLS